MNHSLIPLLDLFPKKQDHFWPTRFKDSLDLLYLYHSDTHTRTYAYTHIHTLTHLRRWVSPASSPAPTPPSPLPSLTETLPRSVIKVKLRKKRDQEQRNSTSTQDQHITFKKVYLAQSGSSPTFAASEFAGILELLIPFGIQLQFQFH